MSSSLIVSALLDEITKRTGEQEAFYLLATMKITRLPPFDKGPVVYLNIAEGFECFLEHILETNSDGPNIYSANLSYLETMSRVRFMWE